jgi:hypothetical protein
VIRRTKRSCWPSRPGAQAPISSADTAMIAASTKNDDSMACKKADRLRSAS